MKPTFDINQDGLIKLTQKLSRLRKYDLPNTVRSTLSDTALMAKKTVPMVFGKDFTVRKASFIKSHTFVNKAKANVDINKIVAEFGVIKNKSSAGNRLEAQEKGGMLKAGFMPRDKARISGSFSKRVSKPKYMSRGAIHVAKNKQDFIKKAAMLAKKKSKDFMSYKGLVFRVDSFNRSGKELDIKYDVLYSFRKTKISVK